MGDIVKFGRKTEEEKYEEALLSQYEEHHRPKKTDPNQSVAFIINREKAEIAKKIEGVCMEIGNLLGWEGVYKIEKRFFPMELTTVQIILSVPEITLETDQAKVVFKEAIDLADWMTVGSYEGEISIVFYVKDVVRCKTVKK